jgi:hypothetical protein
VEVADQRSPGDAARGGMTLFGPVALAQSHHSAIASLGDMPVERNSP